MYVYGYVFVEMVNGFNYKVFNRFELANHLLLVMFAGRLIRVELETLIFT